MNILYISHLSNNPWAGPSYSVPAQIAAQSKLDNVFWYNISNSQNAKKWKSISYYHDNEEFPDQKINLLPEPFDKPDIVVVEQFYNMGKSPLIKELLNAPFPYVIIPRCELTREAQKRKRLKKFIANKFLFEKFSQRACAIHYLTKQEQISSGCKWNEKFYVVPNGIEALDKEEKKFFSERKIRCVSIGRMEPYQKGLDLLIKATALVQNQLRKANVTIDLYGPDVDGKCNVLKQLIENNGVGDLVSINNPVFNDDKADILKKSDVFLLLSRFEGHPMALIEALAYGLPCMVTPGSNMYKEIIGSDAGWGTQCDVNNISQSFLTMIKEKELMQRKSINAISLAGHYSWDSIAQKTHEMYVQLLGEEK